MANRSLTHNVIKFILQLLTVALCVVFLLGCLTPYLSPENFWWIGFIGLSTPYLIILIFFATILWCFAKPSMVIISLLTLCLGYKQISVIFACHFNNDFNEVRDSSSLRIIDWNIQGFNGLTANKNIKKLVRTELAESILKLNPDVICLQEFNHSFLLKGHQNNKADNIDLFTKTHPYYYFSKDNKSENGYATGSVIFSKYPISDTGKLKYPKGESALFADIIYNQDTIRIYTTHLQSFKFKKNDYENIDKVEENDEDALTASKSISLKMRPAFKRRAMQANLLKDWMSKSPYPSVLAGDFNDVPDSYTYFTIRGNRQDAFLEKSFGIGKTFIALAPTLRIDYILPDNQFKVKQFELEDEGLSDHYMLVTDLSLSN